MPAPLSACRLANITASSLSLTCDQPTKLIFGPISYRAEVYLENGTLYYNVSSREPSFNVSRLDPATNYQIKVYVSRGPVTSPPVVVSAYTSRSSTRRDDEQSISNYSNSPNGILVMTSLVILLLLCVIVVRFYFKRRKNRSRNRKNGSLETNRIKERNSSSEDMNPDVVPHAGKIKTFLELIFLQLGEKVVLDLKIFNE
ncbi:hypothetical protein Avbf_12845 [Armadillidium vulgare]|nr:hypothetical protein Avbf_12845 [Armadillidium vulgare]